MLIKRYLSGYFFSVSHVVNYLVKINNESMRAIMAKECV